MRLRRASPVHRFPLCVSPPPLVPTPKRAFLRREKKWKTQGGRKYCDRRASCGLSPTQKVASKFARGRNVEDEFCDGSSPKLVLLNDECYVFNSSLVLRVLLLRLYLVEEVYFVIEIGLFLFLPFCFLIVSVLRLR